MGILAPEEFGSIHPGASKSIPSGGLFFYPRDLSLPLSSIPGAMWIRGALKDINTTPTMYYNQPKTGE